VQRKRLEGDGCGLLAEALLKRPVCFRDIRLGIAIDVIFDASLERALALDVLCGDRNRRFLAYGACEMEPRPLGDILIAGNGKLAALVLATDGRPVPLQPGLTVAPDALRRAV
jgi:hypothetical protein